MFTVGHSNRSIDEFLELLTKQGVELLVDVRTVPRSRYNPQFNRENLPGSLSGAAIEYLHMPGLGGLRHPKKDSTNTAWRNDSFRGYADYMQTGEFRENLEELIALASRRRLAIMCAESVPWRCHRSMIADALVARGVEVFHIMTATKANPHKMTSFARVQDGRVQYPAPELDLFD